MVIPMPNYHFSRCGRAELHPAPATDDTAKTAPPTKVEDINVAGQPTTPETVSEFEVS